MRCWRQLCLVLTLLSGCSSHHGGKPPPVPTPPDDHQPWTLCGRTALPAGPAPTQADTGRLEMVGTDRALFFLAEPRGLFTSTGTRGPGTCLVKELPPGPSGQGPSEVTRVGDRVFFAADDAEAGRELWVSDGTEGGTRRVKDLWPGPTGSEPQSLADFNGVLYFAASDPEHGRELWRSDGTPEGTVLVEDLDPGVEGTSPDDLTRGGDGGLYFVAHFQGLVTKLMRSNGGAGAVELARVPAEGGILESLTPMGRQLIFVMGHLHEPMKHLVVTDGNAPVLVSEFFDVSGLTVMGQQLYFNGATGEAGTDAELWRSDGSAEGTHQVRDIQAGEASSSPRSLTVLGARLFFTADDGEHGRELWVSDGTFEGTRLFADLAPVAPGASPEELASLQGNLFFSAEGPERGREPWVSNGTPEGTGPLNDVAPGAQGSNPKGFLLAGWDVFFTADDGSGTRKLYDLPLRPPGQCGASPRPGER